MRPKSAFCDISTPSKRHTESDDFKKILSENSVIFEIPLAANVLTSPQWKNFFSKTIWMVSPTHLKVIYIKNSILKIFIGAC